MGHAGRTDGMGGPADSVRHAPTRRYRPKRKRPSSHSSEAAVFSSMRPTAALLHRTVNAAFVKCQLQRAVPV
jgi:hypothetical protein